MHCGCFTEVLAWVIGKKMQRIGSERFFFLVVRVQCISCLGSLFVKVCYCNSLVEITGPNFHPFLRLHARYIELLIELLHQAFKLKP